MYLKNKNVFRRRGFVDVLTAMAILSMIVLLSYFMSQQSVNKKKVSKSIHASESIHSSIKYFYEAIDCCETLADFAGDLSCSGIHGNTNMQPSNALSHGNKNSVTPRNNNGNSIFKVWASSGVPAGLFADYFATKEWNISLRCEVGKADGGYDSLSLYRFADIKDPLTNKNLATPELIHEGYPSGDLCVCSQIFKHGYATMCSPSSSVRTSYSARGCASPIPAP